MDHKPKVMYTEFAGGFKANDPVIVDGRPAHVVASAYLSSPTMVPFTYNNNQNQSGTSFVRFNYLEHRQMDDFVTERIRFAGGFKKGDRVIWNGRKFIVRGWKLEVGQNEVPIAKNNRQNASVVTVAFDRLIFIK